ncbi:uncharacterized protein Dvar_08140 [Desulfosarcina variabilis str. Montpellier]
MGLFHLNEMKRHDTEILPGFQNGIVSGTISVNLLSFSASAAGNAFFDGFIYEQFVRSDLNMWIGRACINIKSIFVYAQEI